MTDQPVRDLGEMRAVRGEQVGLWRTLGYRLDSWAAGRSVVSWDATADYGFATGGGYVVQGGLVTALLDAAMGGACWTVLTAQAFLTADLRVEFLRSAPAGRLIATGWVVRATPRVVFCAGDLHDDAGTLLASSRCTQVVLPAEHRGQRATGASSVDGAGDQSAPAPGS
ncbi:MAG: PaaI family thioesterase [Jatrophihabitans sp.]|uniref:PaaI family thioesterase n=1 Tax=Jatrophihabitans sp. TaxID=1932789 RepID=UPI00390F9954